MNTTEKKVLELYKFIVDNNIEYHYRERKQYGNTLRDVIIFIPLYLADEGLKFFDDIGDEGYECVIHYGNVCIWMNEFCECYGIEQSDLFLDTEADND